MVFLLTFNISFALLLILIVLYMKEPVQFAIFPSLLLMLTLFRLSLNIASTRLILLDGYAGKVVNAFGNFFNRTITFAHKYFDGKVPPAGRRADVDTEHLQRCAQAVDATADALERCHFKGALSQVMALARAGNGYFDTTKPFLTRKTDMDACGRAINVCLQTARTLATIIAPFLPATADQCAGMLKLAENWRTWSTAAADELPDGKPLGRPEILIKKLDAGKVFGE